MVPTKKEELRDLVTQTTMETYEELTPHLVQLINETNSNPKLTESQKQDEISLHMMGFVKSCTNEIIIEVASGMGEKVVSGEVTPERFVIDKKSIEIKNLALLKIFLSYSLV